ncbi:MULTISPECIES: TetR/AcrR family transcriptional regulator [unclassified Erythrobacter]|jgi:AcrR family transcriptional regulator|uniref:TetR/AcrR family transcriptional regulator n=1 Tax=unclassified Erythrobacter TaxID=2633097 RepID=UPI00076CA6AD|nr:MULTISPECIES: TetR/AcrR family transcriptional regulator [unclassified Erythrobacter]KWV95638.1 TetR family transcriptional regulator [Erythrobacter sp. AP23]MBO6525631.1 TetR/AcrR family transcriptional regulator [Erythrobacter sp.]MBO6529696.1 TetR/AcrR family transcriptional regulator [Erythrobacter sp.]MBO6766676.1 TetR/AcrR family transcriptional regulator [Erythrobacter sp.]
MAATDVSSDKTPRTERGRRTLRKLLDAAATEFAEKGFHEASISGITRSAGVALGTFYTYFDSKDAIFRALVSDMSAGVGKAAREAIEPSMGALEVERAALRAFLEFAAEHKEIYRIIDEAEFVDPESYRAHYETIGARIEERLRVGAEGGEYRPDLGPPEAWALMGMNVFLGLRYVIWAREGDPDFAEVARRANAFLARGIAGSNA